MLKGEDRCVFGIGLREPGAAGWRRTLGWAGLWLCLAAAGMSAQTTQGTPAASPATGGLTPGAAKVPQASQGVTTPASSAAGAPDGNQTESTLPPLAANLGQYAGLKVATILYQGVEFDKTDRLAGELSQKTGEPLDPNKVRQTTRRLFSTGRYRDIEVRAQRTGEGVTLIFAGTPRYYVGRIQVAGIQEDRLASLVEYGSKLNPGAPFSSTDIQTSIDAVKEVLSTNGYYEPAIAVHTSRDDTGQQVNVIFTVAVGPQARVGAVVLDGKDPGITVAQFRKKGKLKAKTRVGRETASNALSNLRDYFQKKNRLEATVNLKKTTYDPATKTLNYDFGVEQGPVVRVDVAGAKFAKSRLHLLVPVFEEGAVDVDLLNEGTYNMKDFLQQQGYFDVAVAVKVEQPASGEETVLYSVDKGARHRVVAVNVVGNKYFSSDLLKQGLKVQKGDAYQRSGRYSAQLVQADEKSIQAIYRANGFNEAKVTSSTSDSVDSKGGKSAKYAEIAVTYKIDEGPQQKFGPVALEGVDPGRKAAIAGLLAATPGQPFSLLTLSGDRDAILSYYLSNGFDQARVEVTQKIEAADPTRTDVGYNVTEGEQVFIGRVLESGVHRTRQSVVNEQMRVHAGDPLDQSALLETQRNLYDLALFNEVIAAVQNPAGDAEQKNVVVQIVEAKRWNVTYGFGFEAQTGVPACQFCTQQGTTNAQEGKAGVSPRVSLDVSRINFRGTQDSLTFHGTYGLLEKVATVTFQIPHFYGHKNLAFQASGGYTNVQDITTFASSTLQGDIRVTQKLNRKDTFIYNFEYRRVAVDPNSLAISANLIPQLSEPVRVGGPGITWFHDTRTPTPLDAAKGSYTSVQEFYASAKLGSQVGFNRNDITNSTYYTFGKRKYVFARSTRLGFIETFGSNPNAVDPNSPNASASACFGNLLTTNASCNAVPLPERLYAGGATSIRGFPINGAGPRDLQTGYPVGGSGVLINTLELRLPPPVLPVVGDAVSFVIFHDMGNVFNHVGDMFPSIGRFHQPNEQTCEVVNNVPNNIGTCDFNYFSHDIGLGARYKTPVGPIRVDFSYNLNPPRYPVITQQTSPGVYLNNILPYVGQASHFNFFFSIGQSF